MSEITNILNQFNFKGELDECNLFGSGHINTTYLAKYNEDGKERYYVLQKVNTNIFPDIDKLMDNVFSVTDFLREKIKANDGNPHRETLHFIRTGDGSKYFRDDDGCCYRAYRFVDNSQAYDTVDSAEIFGKSGKAFGRFQKYLSDFPAETLNEIIENFHNTIWRYENEFIPAVQADKADRVVNCGEEIKFVMRRREDCNRFVNLIEQGKLPIRVTHNDTKLNNVLFDKDTDEAICVIDLDTVMPGLALYDFGDSIRFGANSCVEDDDNYDNVRLMLDYFEAYAKGFLSEAGQALNQCEIDNLAFSAKLMTFECGMRFLTDYINGDTYFKTAYPEHNLVRARNQFALVADIERKLPQMEKIIADITNK